MAIDFSKIVSELGNDLIAQCGEPVGLDRDQSVRVATALGQHMGGGKDLAIKATAADTGLSEEVISAMLGKLTVLQGSAKSEAVLKPGGPNRLDAAGIQIAKGARVLAVINTPGGKAPVIVRYQVP